jgi:nucleoside-diphosphate-sugar epimerase
MSSPIEKDIIEEHYKDTDEVSKQSTDQDEDMVRNILVTGGSGLVGSAIVRQLMQASNLTTGKLKYKVISLDLSAPSIESDRYVQGVEYVSLNLSLNVDEIVQLLIKYQIHGIIHTAGLVLMKNDPATLTNVNVLATEMLLHAAYSKSTYVTCFIITSSTSVVHPGTHDIENLSPSTQPQDPYVSPKSYSSAYACSKAKAELLTLSYGKKGAKVRCFRTCALRLPGVYGYNDPWLFGPLLRGELHALPGDPKKCVEMVYVENAAHGHVCALETLLCCKSSSGSNDSSISRADKANGLAYHITNGEPKVTMGEFLNYVVSHAPNQPVSKPLQLPLLLSKTICLFVEFVYWFTQGNVFMKHHPVWNFTRASLGYMTHHNSFSTDGNDVIGYVPLFSSHESVHDIYRFHKIRSTK